MRSYWSALHEHFLRQLDQHATQHTFEALRGRHACLEAFGDPVALIDWLHDPNRNRDLKDSLLLAVLAEARRPDSSGDTATTLLHLALWPGLDAIYRRRLRYFRGEPGALVSEIAARLLTQIRESARGCINRPAATLLRNIDRDIGRTLRRTWTEAALREPSDVLNKLAADAGVPLEDDPDAACRALISAIEPVVGRDAGLVVDVAVRGATQREAGEARGLGHDAARKRHQRAMARLRTAAPILSQSADASGVSFLTARPSRRLTSEGT
ncbi:MAG: hypothetical protein AAF416_17055 [Pseudomonadota bacterium]